VPGLLQCESYVGARHADHRDHHGHPVEPGLSDLAERDGVPKIDKMPDLRNWWRYGQESFVALRPNAWHMPERVTVSTGWTPSPRWSPSVT
jgi:hypothetical protein